MANEISATAILKCFNSTQSIDVELKKENASFTQTGDSYAEYIQTIGTSEEALELGQDIGTPGYALLINLDTTNFVSVRRATGEGNFCRLDANGGLALIKLSATAPFVIADTGACRIKVLLLEA